MKKIALVAALLVLLHAGAAMAGYTTTGTIANGASLSGAVDVTSFIDVGNPSPVGIIMPASWTTADLTFQASQNCSTYTNLYDALGNEYTVKAAASRFILLDRTAFVGFRCFKIRSGTSGSPVNQGAQRILTVNLI